MKRGRVLFNAVVVAAFAIFCVGGLLFTALNLGLRLPGQGGYQVRADFASTEGLVDYADVRESGVLVGHVVDIAADGQGGTLITMSFDQPVRLRADTQAVVRPKSLLGETYVELVRRPDSTASYLASGATIPRADTGQAVQIDTILNHMDVPTRAALSQTLQQLGVALDGRAGDVNASIPQLDQTASNLRPLAQLGARRQQNIDRILTDLNTIMAALADEQKQLGDVVDSGNRVFGALAARDQQLAGTVTQAATLFTSLDQVFNGLTPADRSSLEQSPGTLQAARKMLTLTGPEIDKILPELLLAQINYPNNQLQLTDPAAISLSREWISAFSQNDQNGRSFRIVSIAGSGSAGLPPLPGSPAPLPGSPVAAAPVTTTQASQALVPGSRAGGWRTGDMAADDAQFYSMLGLIGGSTR